MKRTILHDKFQRAPRKHLRIDRDFPGTLIAADLSAVAASQRSISAGSMARQNVRYAHVLRCIGQTLEPLDLKSLELKTHGANYVVQGWNRAIPVSKEVDRQYTPDDVKKLEIEGREQRKILAQIPNLLALSQVLRLAGNYVDRMRGRLIRISWQDQSDKIQSITIQYEPFPSERSEHGESQITTIEELCIHVYRQRKKMISVSDKTSPRPLVNLSNGNPAAN